MTERSQWMNLRAVRFCAALICLGLSGCPSRSSGGRQAQHRWVEPRISGVDRWDPCRSFLPPGHVVEQAQCSPSPELHDVSGADCEVATEGSAVRALMVQPACTDAAVESLEKAVALDSSGRSLNDLAAAYYVRAQRQDRPSDLLRAYAAARQALTLTPIPREEARFNAALLQEALGLDDRAAAAWDEVARGETGPWAEEARAHRRRLLMLRMRAADSDPRLLIERLTDASSDPVALKTLISAAPLAMQRHLEDELLPQWAQVERVGKREDAQRRLVIATAAATEIARQSGDRCLFDTAKSIERAVAARNAQTLEWLQDGFLAYAEGRAAERGFRAAEASAAYTRAETALARTDNPFRGVASLRLAIVQNTLVGGDENNIRRLRQVTDQARAKRYDYLWIRGQAAVGFALTLAGRWTEALDRYEEIGATFEALHDHEGMAQTALHTSAIYRSIGQYESAWRKALLAQRSAAWLDGSSKQAVAEECASAALGLGHPEVAAAYADVAIRMAQDALSQAPEDHAAAGRVQLASAMSARATIDLYLDNLERAQRDIVEAARLSGSIAIDSDTRLRAIRARLGQVRGELLLNQNPAAAAAAFSDALGWVDSDEYRIFRANLLVERSAAYAKAGQRDVADRDLRSAYETLRTTADGNLSHRFSHGDRVSSLWRAYFSQTDEVYRRLIMQLVDAGRFADAFLYVEQARAFKYFNLTFGPGPQRRRLEPEVFDVAEIQRQLPPNTCVVSYFVMESQTFVWVVTRGRIDFIRQPVGRYTIERWTADIQSAAGTANAARFAAALFAPFQGLLAGALQRVDASFASSADRNLVIIPDGPMSGLPFSALRDSVTRRYLAEDYAVALAPSSTQYIAALTRAKHGGASDILLIGDPAFRQDLDVSRDLRRLPAARQEIDAIRALYGSNAIVMSDTASTPASFLKLAPKTAIVHFAGHSIVESQEPLRSTLVLAPSRDSSGLLSAEDVLAHLRVERTQLVVLSTCSSAGGLPVGSQGLASMAGSFLSVGVPAVIGSLWSTPDQATERLMVSFHKHYREGHDAAHALRLAQIEFLRDTSAASRSAILWASFELFGYAPPLVRHIPEAVPR